MDVDMDEPEGSPRGTKRTIAGIPKANAPRRIQPLAQDVINKIAAGEIIVAPVHALKELIENAVDAGATSISVLVKEGGLKLLQITDNGHGIHRDDMPLLCERFTTSKLKTFDDLTSIGTYGFRGEALASISHIAHLTVTTKTADSSCAWRALYEGGKLQPLKPGQSADPKPTAGQQGTQLTVEDLFYNIPTRRRAFRSASEEYTKIIDLVGRYAVHCSHVAFTCKKHNDNSMGISVMANASTLDRIRQTHGSAVANELIELKCASETLGFKADGYVSNANYNVKRTSFLLFINHRSVESTPIRKALEATYAAFLPKGGHPFLYLSLEIEPSRVDVNVHPTKREVRFLHEDEIIENICDELRTALGKVDTSRTFMTQSLITKTPLRTSTSNASTPWTNVIPDKTPGAKTPTAKMPTTQQKPYENNLVRTDSKARKITSMLAVSQRPSTDGTPILIDQSIAIEPDYEIVDREYTLCRLTTIKELRASVREEMHNELTDVFASHTYVGLVDERRRLVAMQGGVKLFLVDYGLICYEFFYQVGLTDFGNFGVIKLKPPLDLKELLMLGAKQTSSEEGNDFPPNIDLDHIVQTVYDAIMARKDMLSEYFSLEISETGELLTIPLLIKGYTPSMAKLPQFLLRLGPFVNWTEEKACFETFLRELARLYVPEKLPLPPPVASTTAATQNGTQMEGMADVEEEEDVTIAARRKHVARALEMVLFPAFKARLVATKDMLKGVIEVANLKGLYRVFERC